MGQSGQSRRSFGEHLPGRGLSPPVSFTSQMVFYIEACESGSMMRHLPTDINGRWWEPWPLSRPGEPVARGCSWSISDSATVKNQDVYISGGLGAAVEVGR